MAQSMRFARAIAYISPALLLLQCQPAFAAKKKATGPLTLSQFVERISREGDPALMPPTLAKLMGFPLDAEHRALSVDDDATTDGRGGTAQLVLARSEGNSEARPIGIYWSRCQKDSSQEDCKSYHSTLEGTLVKAVRILMQVGEGGKIVKGSAQVTKLDTEAKEVTKEFTTQVLDFWLKGKYRAPRRKKS